MGIPRAAHRWPCGLVPLLAGPLLLAGCVSAQFGRELAARPTPMVLNRVEGMTVRLPQEQPFNITLARAAREPGLAGTAEVDAYARPEGAARASAAVENGGKSEALFQIGHALRNGTDRQADFACRVQFEYEFETQAPETPGATDAFVGLRLYARLERGRLLRDVPLTQHAAENGAVRRSSREQVEFTLTLGPGDAVDVFVAGQARVEVPEGRSATCAVTLRGLEMEVVTRPASAVATADGPGGE
jgi:hypothetical protein